MNDGNNENVQVADCIKLLRAEADKLLLSHDRTPEALLALPMPHEDREAQKALSIVRRTAKQLFLSERTEEAIVLFEGALELAKDSSFSKLQCKLLRSLGDAHRQLGNFSAAVDVYQRGYTLAEATKELALARAFMHLLNKMQSPEDKSFSRQSFRPPADNLYYVGQTRKSAHVTTQIKKNLLIRQFSHRQLTPTQYKKGATFSNLFREGMLRSDLPTSGSKFVQHTIEKLCTQKEPAWELFRTQLEVWYQHLPSAYRHQLHARLTSLDDIQHVSAFFELFFHEYFYYRRWKSQIEPLIAHTRPDFFVDTGDCTFYLEVLTAWRRSDTIETKAVLHGILKHLDTQECKHLIEVHFKSVPLVDSIKTARPILDAALSRVNASESGADIDIEQDGLHMRITAHARGAIVTAGNVCHWSLPTLDANESEVAIQRALSKDLAFAHHVEAPIVLAVCARDNSTIDDIAISHRLYGTIDIHCSRSSPASVFLKGNGAGFGPEHNTRISAILYCRRHWDRGRMLYDIKLYHNPWARHPIQQSIFDLHPQLVPVTMEAPHTLQWIGVNNQTFCFGKK